MEKTQYLEAFVQRLARLLEEPRGDLPSVRCVSRSTLYSLFNEVRAELGHEGVSREINQYEIVDFLVRMSVLMSIPVRGNGDTVYGVAYYAVGFEPEKKEGVDPKELLQAAFPAGVICYFTALSFHGLTTQVPSHHHIARIREDRERPRANGAQGSGPRKGHGRGSYSRMGRPLFRYKSESYYWTTRSPRVLRAFAAWRLNPKLTVRVVTLEQALVDTLHKPMRCGGPAVIQEAWEEAVEEERLNQVKLAAIIEGADAETLARRVGYLLSEMGVKPAGELREVMGRAMDNVDRSDSRGASAFLPDYSCTIYDEDWHLMVPDW